MVPEVPALLRRDRHSQMHYAGDFSFSPSPTMQPVLGIDPGFSSPGYLSSLPLENPLLEEGEYGRALPLSNIFPGILS